MVKTIILALFFVPFLVFVGWVVLVATGALRAEKRERQAPTTFHPDRGYFNWTPRDGWPRGPYLHYQCMVCGGIVPSKAPSASCQCGNVFVEGERIGAKDETKVKLFEERPENNPNPVIG